MKLFLLKKLDADEKDVLTAYERGEFKSTYSPKADLAKFKTAASATGGGKKQRSG